MSEHSMQGKCSTGGFQHSLAAFLGKMDQAPSLRHECLAALLGHAHSPGLGCCPSRDWEQSILLPLTQLYQADEQRLRAPGDSLHFQSNRYAGLSSSTELETGCLKPHGKLHALLTPLCPGARAWGEAWFALDSAEAASWHVPAVPAQPTEQPWSWKTAPELLCRSQCSQVLKQTVNKPCYLLVCMRAGFSQEEQWDGLTSLCVNSVQLRCVQSSGADTEHSMAPVGHGGC